MHDITCARATLLSGALLLPLSNCVPIQLDPIDTGTDDPGTSGATGPEPTTAGDPDDSTSTTDDGDTAISTTDDPTGGDPVTCSEVVVADPQLLLDIRAALAIPDGPIPPEAAQTLTELTASPGITTLDGLECFPNLTDLIIGGVDSTVTDLGPLAGLTKLATLVVAGSPIVDLGPLAGLPALAKLNINETGVEDLTPLAAVPTLAQLSVFRSPIGSFAPLAGHPGLTRIDAQQLEGAVDPTGLAQIPQLRYLDLSFNKLGDLEFLAGAPALSYLGLVDVGVADITPLADITTLESLFLTQNNITGLAPLAGLTALVSLSVDDNLVASVAPLAGLTALEELRLSNNAIVDVAPLTALTKLWDLHLFGNKISDLAPLAALPGLKQLDVGGNPLPGLDALIGAPTINGLVAADAGLTELAVVSPDTLALIDVQSNSITDVSPLLDYPHLDLAYLRDNQVTTLEPLLGATWPDNCAVDINVQGNPLDAETLASIIPALCASGLSILWDDGHCEC